MTRSASQLLFGVFQIFMYWDCLHANDLDYLRERMRRHDSLPSCLANKHAFECYDQEHYDGVDSRQVRL